VAVNNDNLCPSTLQNQQYVQYLAQAAPRGLVTLNTRTPELSYDGDYYISSTVSLQRERWGWGRVWRERKGRAGQVMGKDTVGTWTGTT
jgi:hypothetical protein